MDVIIMDMGDDIKGESSVPGYENKIELLSFSHGVATPITGDVSSSERSAGKLNHQDMTVHKYLDAASPQLQQGCFEGKAFPRVDILIGRNEGGGVSVKMRYTLKNAIISSISVGGGGGDKPVEAVTLNYQSITWEYK